MADVHLTAAAADDDVAAGNVDMVDTEDVTPTALSHDGVDSSS